MNSGQICSAGSRLFIEERIYEEFVGRVADYAKSLKVGHGLMEDTIIGPLVSQQQLDRVTGFLESGASEGGVVLSGGKRLTGSGYDQGYFVPPTVFGNVRDDMRIMQEEIFGPVLSATPFNDIDQMLKRANGTSFGLGSGVWTRDLGKAHRMARALQAGSVWINCYQTMDPAVPFGGYKMSGYGRESGIQHVYDYLNTKSVWINAG
jgi:aldehyde dehydrogenase (NAD+)